ncbi:GyrI-like small molecule binding protein [Spirosoma oryzae]|uniref:GyrI-like small molecule binding protein n=1 Tax=Spirosoma oryzae TaxID=1469603 RepID=A0A2T0T885_9BACT|nr:GyrI-like domain-containing protein [Spirosoma oryzae]PRY41873.1 GyrI-like small molecule binding protein [Spirosoma oryzae]
MTTEAQSPSIILALKTVPPFLAIVSSVRVTLKRLNECVPVMQSLYAEAARLGLTITGPSQWHYIGASGDDNQEFQLDVVLPIQHAGPPSETFVYNELPAFSCVSHAHTGAWSDMPAVYDQLFSQFYRDGYSEGTVVREVHIVADLEQPAQCVTEVQIGIV